MTTDEPMLSEIPVVDIRAEFAQRRENRADRPLPGPCVTVEMNRGRGERRHRRQEAHDGPRVAHVHADPGARRRLTGGNPPDRSGLTFFFFDLGPQCYLSPECAQRARGQPRVPGQQRVRDRGRALAEGGQHQGAVGDGLRRGQPDAGADRPGGGRGMPEPVLVVIHRLTLSLTHPSTPARRGLASPDFGYERPIQA